MPNITSSSVVDLPRRGIRLVAGSTATCLAWIKKQAAPDMKRVALVLSADPPDDVDAAVCVPFAAFGDWEAQAATIVDGWESKWLLLQSMPARHRDEARADLHHAVASGLISAAVAGIDDQGGPDVGF